MNILNQKTPVTAFVVPKLRTVKTLSDKCLKSHVSEDNSTCNMVNVPKLCSNLHQGTFTIFIDHCQVNQSLKKSFLLTCKIIGLLVNILAADEKYLVLHRDILTIPIQM